MGDAVDQKIVVDLLKTTTDLLNQLSSSSGDSQRPRPEGKKKPKNNQRGSQSMCNLSGNSASGGQSEKKKGPPSVDGGQRKHMPLFSDFPPPYDSIVGGTSHFQPRAQPSCLMQGFPRPTQFSANHHNVNYPVMSNFGDPNQIRPPLLNPNFAPRFQHPQTFQHGIPPTVKSQYRSNTPPLAKVNNPHGNNSLFVSLDDLIKEIIKFVGYFTTVENLARVMNKDFDMVLKVIKNNRGIFSTLIDSSTKKTMVELCPSVQLCKYHVGSNGCYRKNCFDLHICHDFVVKSCVKKCPFGHSFKTNHNMRILQSLHLTEIPHDVLLKLIKKFFVVSDFPSVCSYYNADNCQKGDSCSNLHICLEYVRSLGNCTKDGCSLRHDIQEKKITSILKSFGICTNESPRDLLRIVKDKCGVAKVDEPSSSSYSSKPASTHNKATNKKNDRGKSAFVWQMNGSVHTPLICLKGVYGKCPYISEGCNLLHGKKTYHWQFGSKDKWYNFHAYHAEILESKFRDVNTDRIQLPNLDPTKVNDSQKDLLKLLGTKNLQVDFDSMTIDCEEPQKVYNVRHITTESSVVCNDSRATNFLWYFRSAKGKWELYGNSEVSSSSIEKSYKENPSGKMTFKSSNGFSYEIDFSKMMQTNEKTKTRRPIRRRSDDNSMDSSSESDKTNSSVKIPGNWQPFGENETFKLVRLSNSKEEYKKLFQLISLSMPMVNIVAISRIQNEYVWKQFCHKKSELMKKKGVEDLNIQNLFCGINSDNLEDICRDNLDWRVHEAQANKKCGNGAYFYNSAAVAYQNSVMDFLGKRRLLVFSVILGSVAQGEKGMTRPPNDPQKDCIFDTTTDDLSAPMIYVKYNKQEYYPSYVIEIL